jgi:hypothetical protein
VSGVAERFRHDGQPEAHWVRVGAAIGLASIALQSIVEFSLQMPGNAVLFAVLLALALYVPAQRVSPPAQSERDRPGNEPEPEIFRRRAH